MTLWWWIDVMSWWSCANLKWWCASTKSVGDAEWWWRSWCPREPKERDDQDIRAMSSLHERSKRCCYDPQMLLDAWWFRVAGGVRDGDEPMRSLVPDPETQRWWTVVGARMVIRGSDDSSLRSNRGDADRNLASAGDCRCVNLLHSELVMMVDSSDLLQLDPWRSPLWKLLSQDRSSALCFFLFRHPRKMKDEKPPEFVMQSLKLRWKLLSRDRSSPLCFFLFRPKDPQKMKDEKPPDRSSRLDENFSSLKIDLPLSVSFFSGQKMKAKNRQNSPSVYDDLLFKEKSRILSILPSKVGDSSPHQKMNDEWSKMNVQWWSSDLPVLRTPEDKLMKMNCQSR